MGYEIELEADALGYLERVCFECGRGFIKGDRVVYVRMGDRRLGLVAKHLACAGDGEPARRLVRWEK